MHDLNDTWKGAPSSCTDSLCIPDRTRKNVSIQESLPKKTPFLFLETHKKCNFLKPIAYRQGPAESRLDPPVFNIIVSSGRVAARISGRRGTVSPSLAEIHMFDDLRRWNHSIVFIDRK